MSDSIIEYRDIDLDVDIQADELSILSFSDDISKSINEVVGGPQKPPAETDQQQEQSKHKNNTLYEIEIYDSVPISDDESISDASLFSDISLQSMMCDEDEQQSQKTCEEEQEESSSLSVPSNPMEEMIIKLSRSMMRSACTRALISKTVFPELRKSSKLSLHKAKRSSAKHGKKKGGIATRSVVLGASMDNSICGFLRATKKW